MVRQSDAPAGIEFGHFSIFPHRRQLLADGQPIALGDRAFDVLMALIEVSGAVVGKDELLRLLESGSGCVEVRDLCKHQACTSADSGLTAHQA